MLAEPSDISTITHVIQSAIAPVFMLAGISALLGVMTTRLHRVIDRSRILEKILVNIDDPVHQALVRSEMSRLLKRGKAINWAIILATTSELMVCLVIIVIFLGNLISFPLSDTVTVLFIVCMLSLSLGLSFFLLEVSLATSYMREGLTKAETVIQTDFNSK